MPFKKVNPTLETALNRLNLNQPTPLQTKAFAKIKSGADLFLIGAKDSGKTWALIMGVAQKLKAQPKGDNPRAVIFVANKEEAIALKEKFDLMQRECGFRVSTVYEERLINHQKDEIYLGTDIVIGTPARISKLYFLNGINLTELQLIAVEDAEFLTGTGHHTVIDRICESMEKCQRLVIAKDYTSTIEKLRTLFMQNAGMVKP